MQSIAAAGFENAPEQRVPIDLSVRGTIPPWLTGVLYRTGPGTYRIPSSVHPRGSVNIQHWFDGAGMNHRFEIHPGGQRVSYTSRKSTDDYEKVISDQGKVPGITFAQQPDICQTVSPSSPTEISDSPSGVNVSVTLSPDMPGWNQVIEGLPTNGKLKQYHHLGPKYLVAKTDSNLLQLLDPVSLEPLASATYKTLDPRLDGEMSAAHSCWDKETNEFYNFTCKFGPSPTYKVFKINGDSSVEILAQIKDAPPSYLHSFAMTSKYVILMVWQAHIANYGLSVLYHQNIAQAIEKWKPDSQSLFYVIDKKNGGVVRKYKTPPFFAFHQINAYDDPANDDIVIDVSVYENHSIIQHLHLDKLRTLSASNPALIARPRRFRLPAVKSSTTGKTTAYAQAEFTLPPSESIELPTVNPANYHLPYRYAYGINHSYSESDDHYKFSDRIIKIDMEHPNGGQTKFWTSPGFTPGEPIFVPRPGTGGNTEDDGVLVSIVLDGMRGKSMLVVLDAKSMEECARAEMESVFPLGFHGVFSQMGAA
ncbi:hypothetical protein D9757_009998 [Collybiopsis confluens]|uniref:Carotenoid oxygenase n=1 Tax=Collybiopsis confluens TaxID=2823264 RepID=A0A8H5LW18_9AGAR|nr:hypothetical protein D9757_009998 [Collybiopsis confluens]